MSDIIEPFSKIIPKRSAFAMGFIRLHLKVLQLPLKATLVPSEVE
jgi:hypothetical protein